MYFLMGIIFGAAIMFAYWTVPQSEVTELSGPTEYTCELSGGSIENGSCVCPIEPELGQTQDMMYDESTGFCQTTFGGAGGDAFAAGSGLPWGHYAYWNTIITTLCEESGGSKSGAACICPDDTTYSKTTGQCE